MTTAVLTAERILETAEEVLRRHGPAKANVVDVARALGVSHGSVYRHFPSKAALRDAVVERWLTGISAPLQAVAAGDGPPEQRLRAWLGALRDAKRSKARDEPELFAAYAALAEDATAAVAAHVGHLVDQLERIVGDRARAKAIFDATVAFHHPAHAVRWELPGQDEAFGAVLDIAVRGALGNRRLNDLETPPLPRRLE